MLHLPTVTLLQIDTLNRTRAERASLASMKEIQFAEDLLLEPESVKNHEDYNRFVVKELHAQFDTEHCLLIQWDGYVINPQAWTNDFLQYDYIGAPWDTGIVGNGGFSLRSKRFCELTAKIKTTIYNPEDVLLCRSLWREVLEVEHGMRYAPTEVAELFSWERSSRYQKYNGAFGFHRVNPLGK